MGFQVLAVFDHGLGLRCFNVGLGFRLQGDSGCIVFLGV